MFKVFPKKSRLKKVLIVLASLGILMLILPISMSIIFYIASRLSKPANLGVAKAKGVELSKVKGQTVMLIGAHPDDADWYAGGTLAALHKNGNKVVIIVATSGEKGGSEKNLGRTREQEQLKAAEYLQYDEVKFLRFKDRDLKDEVKLIPKLKSLIQEYKPKIIFTFDSEKEGYVYRHSDHKAAGAGALEAGKDFEDIDFYFFHSSKNNLIFDIEEVKDLKTKALGAHKSQRRRSRFIRILRYLPLNLFRSGRFESAGSAQSFMSIGIEYGEMYRKASI
ncbi:MAG: PIG-L family deacetylase [Actinobacteria bacterium]|nr:MAG: PIG-L family deacetylase [Actinomycetota bacterium]